MPRQVRIPGGYTVFYWENDVIAFCDEVNVTAVTPTFPAQVIQPLNWLRPAEIVTSRAHTNGVMTLTLTELWNTATWQRLAHLTDSRDIIDIMENVAALDQGIQVRKYIRTPGTARDYYEIFFNVTVVEVTDGEDIRIDTPVLNKPLVCWFTHSLKMYPGLPKTARPPFFT